MTETLDKVVLAKGYGKVWKTYSRISTAYESSNPDMWFFVAHFEPSQRIGEHYTAFERRRRTDRVLEECPLMGTDAIGYYGTLYFLKQYATQQNMSVKRVSVDKLPKK